jgi:hypothetical protein
MRSAGNRKYNIWIAYSDLFTNLSAFLFISALGVFVAMGSRANKQPLDSGDGRCHQLAQVDSSITGAGWSLLTPMRPPPRQLGVPCSRYYRIGDYRFHTAQPFRGAFLNAKQQKLSERDVIERVCQPLWDTMSVPAFRRAHALVVFQGVATLNTDWKYPPVCPKRAWTGPPINHPAYARMVAGTHRTPGEALQHCEQRGGYEYCQVVRRCRGSDPNESLDCRQVDQVRAWQAQEDLACLKGASELQVLTLYEICKGAPYNEYFKQRKVNAASSELGDNFESKISALQSRMTYNVTAVGENFGDKARTWPFDALKGGSVIIEVRSEPLPP